MSQSLQAPASRQKQFMDLYRQGKHKLAMTEAEKLVQNYPEDAFAWKALGNCQLQIAPDEAKETLERAYALDPDDPLTLTALARACFMAGEKQRAQALQARSIELDSGNAQAHFNMGHMLYQMGSYSEAEKFLSKAEELGHSPAEVLAMRSVILSLHFKFKEGLEALNRLYTLRPQDPTVHNTLGNYHKDMADFRKAEWHYREALRLRPDYSGAYSNEILTKHYDPEASAESILEKSKKWSARFKPPQVFDHGKKDTSPNRRLRVGLLSGNLRAHPVGWMISSALEQLPEDIELHAYSDADAGDNDPIAKRIKQACEWHPVYHLNHRQLAEKIFEDDIDILIELAGHGGLNRLPTVDTKPAPIIVKWVGMQISSMGIDAFDYFLSDSHETPAGVDHLYTEKLIRLPDDYISYQPPGYKPAITALPSLSNGYITFGCFNNPAKVNDTLLAEWAILLQQLPGSRLFLKGGQYSSDEVCERVLATLERHGVERSRVLLEGPSQHKELLESYNRVDIALDTWPYSGGLTTCEALLMGVPVVTHTGPTFAGRHSATHLCNAGMPELVTDNWEDYRKRVLDLASDLPSLAVIRAALRTYLEQSPICDAPRFARNLHKALRAIWQRHCEDKAPAALTFNKGGQAWFEDEAKPVKLPASLLKEFDWDLESPITILDNGCNIVRRGDIKNLLGTGNVAMLVFDPACELDNASELSQYGELEHLPQVTLGDGHPTPVILNDTGEKPATLEPLKIPDTVNLETFDIASVSLDSIEGLESIDLLALDDRHDNLEILEHGSQALAEALVLQIRVRFNPIYKRQTELGHLIQWADENGFQFYRFHSASYAVTEQDKSSIPGFRASQLISADALLIPNDSRLSTLSEAQRKKLAFLAAGLYGIEDFKGLLPSFNKEENIPDSLKMLKENNKGGPLTPNDIISLVSEEDPLDHEKGAIVVGLTDNLNRFDASAVDSLLESCRDLLEWQQSNNAAFFILTHALLSRKEDLDDSEKSASLRNRLARVKWEHKGPLYDYWLSQENVRNHRTEFDISAIIIANRFKPEIVKNLSKLREEGGNKLQIVFVNNGCPDEEFKDIEPWVDTWLKTSGNAGAYLARNIGALYSEAPILLFVDDDGIPEPGFIDSHIRAHEKWDIVSLRGVYHQPSGLTGPSHYYPCDKPLPAPPELEGNASFSAKPFFEIGGWGDYILFGHGGVDISYRLIQAGYSARKQAYDPGPVLIHEYLRGQDHAKEKIRKQADSWVLLNALHSQISKHFSLLQEAKSQGLISRDAVTRASYAEDARTHPKIDKNTSEQQSDSRDTLIEPKVTLPPEVENYITELYQKSSVILEYGSGGSTIIAAKMPNKHITSVENDAAWARNMDRYIESADLLSRPNIMHVDVGETGLWAKPKNDAKWRNFHRYPTQAWHHDDFVHPDVVLIDGRFRRACFITTFLMIEKPTIVLFDDYTDRHYYHEIERLAEPTETVGRMARFDLVPSSLPRKHLAWILENYNKVAYGAS
ncbi:CDC27 family protein [Salinicola lusitanus]|uniref:protein O-GlcNAc transferase n=1 Tax=Salinicola lusitanus TaxID=1949085 RepID=A0ABZ3CR04_9GAMM